MRFLSVCSGIEAASVAWKPLGWTAAGFSEIEPFPRAVLEQRHGAVAVDFDHRHSAGTNITPLFGDFTQIGSEHVGPIDLLVGGTPCQAFSVAGKRLGMDDPRGNLTIEFFRLAKRLGARWVVWENVPGVLSNWSGEPDGPDDERWIETSDFAAILSIFQECGYRGGWRVLDAQYVRVDGFGHAVPQRRRRVFLVGYLGKDNRAATVLFDRESVRGHSAPRRTAGQGTSCSAEASSGSGSCGSVKTARMVAFGEYEDDGTASTVKARDHKDATDFVTAGPLPGSFSIQAGALRENPNSGPDGIGVQEGVAYTLEARAEVQAVAHTLTSNGDNHSGFKDERGLVLIRDVSETVTVKDFAAANTNDARGITLASNPTHMSFRYQNDKDGIVADDVSATLKGSGSATDEKSVGSYLLEPTRIEGLTVRRLTPRECERLQGFPDDFTAIEWRGKGAPDGPRYKALGNSMAVNVMRWIGTRIAFVEDVIKTAGGSQ